MPNNKEAMRYLEKLTVGGSEYDGDPKACFDYVVSSGISENDILIDKIKEVKRLQAVNEVLKMDNSTYEHLLRKSNKECQRLSAEAKGTVMKEDDLSDFLDWINTESEFVKVSRELIEKYLEEKQNDDKS